MNRKELSEYKEIEELEQFHEDLQANHPAILKMQEEERREKEALEKDRRDVLARIDRKKSKVYKEKIKEVALQGIEEFNTVNPKKPQPIRRPKKVSPD